MLKKKYVWEFPVRLTHWVNFVSVFALSFTGYYISAPFIHAVSSEQHIMGVMREIHFIAAYFLLVSVMIRIYWMFMGNKYAHWDELFPVTAERWNKVFETAKFYMFLRKTPPAAVGHSALAGVTYLAVFFFLFLEIITGFALYSLGQPRGLFWTLMGGWIFNIMSIPTVRLYHYMTMWFLIAFTILHVYIAWLLDSVEKNGLMSSIFSGYKAVDEK